MVSKRPSAASSTPTRSTTPTNFPSPTQPPPDLVSPAFEHLLAYGSMRELTEEELARAVQLDPSQIAGLGPSLEALMEMLRERKRKILETYETKQVKKEADAHFRDMARSMKPPAKLAERFRRAVREEQLRDLERLWYRAGDERARSPGSLCSWSTSWATSTRSTSWRRSTSSPAARR